MNRSLTSLWQRWNGIVVAGIMLLALEIWPPVSPQWHMAFRIVLGIMIYVTIVGLDWYDAIKTFDLDDTHTSPRTRDALHAYEQDFYPHTPISESHPSAKRDQTHETIEDTSFRIRS